MLNREMMPAGAARKAEVSEPQRFRFITSRSGNEVNFFRFGKSTLPDSKYFKVYINGTETVQNYKAISFAKGDEITIQLIDDTQYYPYIKTFEGLATPINYFREILEPLPQMFIKSGQAVTDFTNCFSQCSNLTTIPAGLFDNNTAVTDFGLCFYNCTNLTAIPAGLFDNNTAVTTFAGCFYYIVKLKNFTLIIGSQKVSYCGRFIYGNSNGTVRVPAGSTTETTFRNANISGLTIEAY